MFLCNSLIAVLIIFIEVQKFTSACFAPPQPEISMKCSEELGINKLFARSTPELEHNRTCLTKCMYEKEGKLDSEGNFIPSKFGNDKSEAVSECQQIINIEEICRKTNALDNCIYEKTDPFMKKYASCQKHKNYPDDPKEPLYNTNNCYNRCQMIIDGSLDKEGKINFTHFYYPLNKNVTPNEALEKCQTLVKEGDVCTYDVNMYYCVSFIINHWSTEQLNIELECSKETKVYPFFGGQYFNISRTCFDRCILIKGGELDKHDITKSLYFKKMNATDNVIDTCQLDDKNIDRCEADMYVYDCVNYIQYANPEFLRKQKECAKETNSHLVSLRNQGFNVNSCQTRCIMIKENQIDSNGDVNRKDLKQYAINETIITESIDECKLNNINNSCKEDVDAYHCTVATIHQKNHALCEGENKNSNASPISVGINLCYSRCIMVQNGQLGSDGEIFIDSFKYLGREESVLKRAIENCKDKTQDEDKCARDVNTYNCVSSEVWRLDEGKNVLINAYGSNSISKI